LAVGALAWATIGSQGAVAALNSDLGTGIRMAAPLGMLLTLALCAQKGILVKCPADLGPLAGQCTGLVEENRVNLTEKVECPTIRIAAMNRGLSR
jgi:hypothetical protein